MVKAKAHLQAKVIKTCKEKKHVNNLRKAILKEAHRIIRKKKAIRKQKLKAIRVAVAEKKLNKLKTKKDAIQKAKKVSKILENSME